MTLPTATIAAGIAIGAALLLIRCVTAWERWNRRRHRSSLAYGQGYADGRRAGYVAGVAFGVKVANRGRKLAEERGLVLTDSQCVSGASRPSAARPRNNGTLCTLYGHREAGS